MAAGLVSLEESPTGSIISFTLASKGTEAADSMDPVEDDPPFRPPSRDLTVPSSGSSSRTTINGLAIPSPDVIPLATLFASDGQLGLDPRAIDVSMEGDGARGTDSATGMPRLLRRCFHRIAEGKADLIAASSALGIPADREGVEAALRVMMHTNPASLRNRQVRFLAALLDLPPLKSPEDLRVQLEAEVARGMTVRQRSRPARLQMELPRDDVAPRSKCRRPPRKLLGRPRLNRPDQKDATYSSEAQPQSEAAVQPFILVGPVKAPMIGPALPPPHTQEDAGANTVLTRSAPSDGLQQQPSLPQMADMESPPLKRLRTSSAFHPPTTPPRHTVQAGDLSVDGRPEPFGGVGGTVGVKIWYVRELGSEPILVGEPQRPARDAVARFFSPRALGSMEELDAMQNPADPHGPLWVFRIDDCGGKRPITARAAEETRLSTTAGFVFARHPFEGALWACVHPDGSLAAFARLTA